MELAPATHRGHARLTAVLSSDRRQDVLAGRDRHLDRLATWLAAHGDVPLIHAESGT